MNKSNELLKEVLFPVRLEPLCFIDKKAQETVTGDRGVAVVRGDTDQIIIHASSDYKLVLHADVITAVEAVFNVNGLNYEIAEVKTGGTRGNKMFLHYILPDYEIEIKGEMYTPFLQVQNSYDKSSLFKTVTGLYRQVCTNGLILYKSTKSLIRAKHFGDRIDLSEIAFDLDEWLESLNITKFKIEELVNRVLTPEFFDEPLQELTERIFTRKKDVVGFLNSGLIDQYTLQLGMNEYAIMNAYTDYATHTLTRMRNFDNVSKSFAKIEESFLLN